jgi:hypothetical protein
MASLGNFPEIAINESKDWRKYYFEVPYCDCCEKADDKEPRNLKLKLVNQEHSE